MYGKYPYNIFVDRSSVVEFRRVADGHQTSFSDPSNHKRHAGLDYLGFRFDGRRVWFRDRTVARFERKTRSLVRREIRRCKKGNPHAASAELLMLFKDENVVAKVGRLAVERRRENAANRTFFSHMKMAARVFAGRGGEQLFERVPYKRWIRRNKTELLSK